MNLPLALAVAFVLGNSVYLYFSGPRFATRYPKARVPAPASLAWGALVAGVAALYAASLLTPSSGNLLEPWWGSGVAGALSSQVSIGWLSLLIDARAHRLPSELTKVMALQSLAAWGLTWVIAGASLRGVVAPALGALLWVLPLLLGARLGQVGKGDVKLAPVLGFGLATMSVPAALVGLALSLLLAGVGAMRLKTRGASRSARFALGPYLIIGSWCAWGIGVVVPLLASLQGV